MSNTIELLLSPELSFKLRAIDNKIAKSFAGLNGNKVATTYNLFDLSAVDDEITFCSHSAFLKLKEARANNIWTSNRGSIKIGRLVKRIFKEKFTDKEIEDFVNAYKGDKNTNILEIVEGLDIKRWYNSSRYATTTGQLGNSCMRHSNCEDFFKIYTNNPDKCKMLIYKKDKLLYGRALLWFSDDGRKFIDRVYTSQDSDMVLFKKWAKENGFISREEVLNSRSLTCRVTLKVLKYDKYPYLDTLYFFNPKSGVLTNHPIKTEKMSDFVQITSTGGSYGTMSDNGYKWDDFNQVWGRQSDLVHSVKDNGWCHLYDAIQIATNGGMEYRFNIPSNLEDLVLYERNYYYAKDIKFSKILNKQLYGAVEVVVDNVSNEVDYLDNNYIKDKAVNINGIFYLKTLTFKNKAKVPHLKTDGIKCYKINNIYYTKVEMKKKVKIEGIEKVKEFKYFTELDYVIQYYGSKILKTDTIYESDKHKKLVTLLKSKKFLNDNNFYDKILEKMKQEGKSK